MNQKMIFRLAIDLGMTSLMLIALAYYITGNALHEYIGVGVLVLFVTHNFLNRRWYKAIFKGMLNVRRFLQIGLNFLFLVTMGVMMVSGLLISSDVFPFIPLENDMVLRQVHVQAGYWGFVIMAVHIGFSWGMVLNSIRKMSGISGNSRIHTLTLRILALLIVVYGVQSSFQREMGSKLFIYSPFGYWYENNSTIVFLIDHLSIMGIYICGTHYALKFIPKQERRAV